MAFLKKRQGRLDAVVLSGGEATLYDGLLDFVRAIREIGGYKIKLDTNGSRPAVIQALLQENLLDYLALDYKAPLERYASVIETAGMASEIEKSLDLLCGQDSLPFEIRTTVHTDFLQETDIEDILTDLIKRGYQGHYYLQNFVCPEQGTLKPVRAQARVLDVDRFMKRNELFSVEIRNF